LDHTFAVCKNHPNSIGAKACCTQGADIGYVTSVTLVETHDVFTKLQVLPEDNGEVFFSEYLIQQRARNKMFPPHPRTSRCQCTQCAKNPFPLPHIQEAINSNKQEQEEVFMMDEPGSDREESIVMDASEKVPVIATHAEFVVHQQINSVQPSSASFQLQDDTLTNNLMPNNPSCMIPYQGIPVAWNTQSAAKKTCTGKERGEYCCEERKLYSQLGKRGRPRHNWFCKST